MLTKRVQFVGSINIALLVVKKQKNHLLSILKFELIQLNIKIIRIQLKKHIEIIQCNRKKT